jgi:CYTH domain-containing protein
MTLEIERKFLVDNEEWRSLASSGMLYRQGYIYTHNTTTVRVRVSGHQGYLTIKGSTTGSTRTEFEYPIPLEDAQEMLETLCDRPLIEKIRYKLQQGELVWEIDEFRGAHEGLILAEVELKDENQALDLPHWIGKEVTADPRYYNANLAKSASIPPLTVQ